MRSGDERARVEVLGEARDPPVPRARRGSRTGSRTARRRRAGATRRTRRPARGRRPRCTGSSVTRQSSIAPMPSARPARIALGAGAAAPDRAGPRRRRPARRGRRPRPGRPPPRHRTPRAGPRPGSCDDATKVLHPTIRRSPYFERTLAHGACDFMVYNHTYMPMGYGRDPRDDYRGPRRAGDPLGRRRRAPVRAARPRGARAGRPPRPAAARRPRVGECRYTPGLRPGRRDHVRVHRASALGRRRLVLALRRRPDACGRPGSRSRAATTRRWPRPTSRRCSSRARARRTCSPGLADARRGRARAAPVRADADRGRRGGRLEHRLEPRGGL